MNRTEIVGVLLLGGQSRRMGSDKSELVFGGKTLLNRGHEKLAQVCGSVVVSGNALRPNMECVPDLNVGEGPADGILSCLRYCQSPILVMPVDTPLIPESYLAQVIEHHSMNQDASLTAHLGKREPLCGIYNPSSIDKFESELSAGEYSVTRICDKLDVNWLDADKIMADYEPHLFTNVNSPADAEFVRSLIPDVQL